MSLSEVAVEGTLKPDGALELDHKPNMPPGRVTVVLRQKTEVVLPKGDPFWQRMQAMWDMPVSPDTAPDGGAHTEAELQRMRAEWDEHQDAIERLQKESRAGLHAP